jgi:hypothetical protein
LLFRPRHRCRGFVRSRVSNTRTGRLGNCPKLLEAQAGRPIEFRGGQTCLNPHQKLVLHNNL